ncbi:MAG: radical SAM protein [Pseudomonadota bacterium]
MLFIYPPVVKPSEPPAGLAKLAGALNRHGLSHQIIDANLEALFHHVGGPVDRDDKWTRRARRHLSSNLTSLFNGQAFSNLDHYKRAVIDINRVVQMAQPQLGGSLTLVNYSDPRFSPVRSQDLIRAAENPGQNPFFNYFSTRLDGLLEDRQPSLIGISLNYLSQALCAFAMAGYLREKAPGLKIIMGGGLVTSWLAGPGWRNPFEGLIDELVAGPGEGPLLLSQGIERIESHYRPDYGAFAGNRYLSPGFILPYSASSGCYWSRCSFCPECAEGNRFRPIPHRQVLTDLEGLLQETGPVLVHLLDNAVSPALLGRLGENPMSVPWYGFARISKELTDLDFCLALKRSGCVMLKLGLESGDQTVLDRLGKGIELETASAVLQNLKAAGIATYVYLLFGTPAEDLASARQTLDFIVRHGRLIGFLNLAIFNLPLYSPDSVNMETEAFYEGDLSLYRQFQHPRGWHRPVVRQFLDREFKRHPAVAAILRRDPPLFTSNHAPFFKNL